MPPFESVLKKLVGEQDLSQLRAQNPEYRIGFTTGCFDVQQAGHPCHFSICKDHTDILVVGVGRDSTLRNLKGNDRPINPEYNRLFSVAAMGDVDFAVLNDKEIREGKIDFTNVMTSLKPNVFLLPFGDEGAREKRNLCDKLGTEFVLVPRAVPEGIIPTSSTQIIERIQYGLRAPVRIDFAGGWRDVPKFIKGTKGYVSNVAISPHISFRSRGSAEEITSSYPQGIGLSTSTAIEVLRQIAQKGGREYLHSETLNRIAERAYHDEIEPLDAKVGRQDPYSIVLGGLRCFEFGQDYATPIIEIPRKTSESFKEGLLLFYTGTTRLAQLVADQLHRNYDSHNPQTLSALEEIGHLGLQFAQELKKGNMDECGRIMEQNWQAQIRMASKSTNPKIDRMYEFAKSQGALGGKLAGAGAGGCFVFYSHDPSRLGKALEAQFQPEFPQCKVIPFNFEYRNIKELNPY